MNYYVITVVALVIISWLLGVIAYKRSIDVKELIDNNLNDLNKHTAELQKYKNKSVENSKKYATSLYLASKPCQPVVIMDNKNKEVNSKDQYYFLSLFDPSKRSDAGRTTQVAPLLFTKAEIEKAANRSAKNQDDMNDIRIKYDLTFVKLSNFVK
jgi:hypothetical protein